MTDAISKAREYLDDLESLGKEKTAAKWTTKVRGANDDVSWPTEDIGDIFDSSYIVTRAPYGFTLFDKYHQPLEAAPEEGTEIHYLNMVPLDGPWQGIAFQKDLLAAGLVFAKKSEVEEIIKEIKSRISAGLS